MMDLIKRYIYAVTQKLPESQRIEIEKELHGLIEDMLEDRGAHVESATHQEVEQVLLELGPPEEMSARYRVRERYLIGPGLIDSYKSVLRIVLYSLGILLSFAYIVDFFTSSDPAGELLIEYFVSLLNVEIQGFVWVTVIFAYLEYRGTRKVPKDAWKPDDLPIIPDPATQIKPIEPVLGIIFSLLFFVLFTFSIDLISVYRWDESLVTIPVFAQAAFAKYLPLIWILTGIGILQDIIKLIARKWTPQVVVVRVVFNIASVIGAMILFSDTTIWNPTFMDQLVQTGTLTPGNEAYDVVNSIWDRAREGLIYVIVIIAVIDTASAIMKLFRGKEGKTVLTK